VVLTFVFPRSIFVLLPLSNGILMVAQHCCLLSMLFDSSINGETWRKNS
jgi:hypothetical protein